MFAETVERHAPERLTDMDWRPSGTTTTLPTQATLWSGVKSYRVLRYPFSGGEFVVTIAGSPPSWVWPTIEGLGGLLSLPANWDTYGASRTDPRYIHAALRLISDTLRDNTPAPSVVPTGRGGVQLEWHTRGIDLEVEFVTPSRLRVSYEDQHTGQAWESDLTRDLKPLTDAIATLSCAAQ